MLYHPPGVLGITTVSFCKSRIRPREDLPNCLSLFTYSSRVWLFGGPSSILVGPAGHVPNPALRKDTIEKLRALIGHIYSLQGVIGRPLHVSSSGPSESPNLCITL